VNPANTAQNAVAAALVALALGAGACGDDDTPSNNPELFLGTWMVTSGMAKATCTGFAPMQSLAGASVQLTAGDDAPLMANVRGCMLKFDIAGNVATARPNQTCTTNFELMMMPVPIELTIASATFKVEGTTGTLMQSGTATIPVLGACPYEATATGMKAPAP
jgi:hypothetical protein